MVFFDKLTFSEVIGLYQDFQRYYEEWDKNSKFVNLQEENPDTW